jgi:hypothetical protein
MDYPDSHGFGARLGHIRLVTRISDERHPGAPRSYLTSMRQADVKRPPPCGGGQVFRLKRRRWVTLAARGGTPATVKSARHLHTTTVARD